MWYNTLPSFVPMYPNMYTTYYSKINGPDPIIYGRKEKCAIGTIQPKLVPPVEQLE
jgi:hypothetical protein